MSRLRCDYGFAGGVVAGAAVSAGGAAGVAVVLSAGGLAGAMAGAGAAAGAEVSGLLLQAASTSAAARALRASFVFIDDPQIGMK